MLQTVFAERPNYFLGCFNRLFLNRGIGGGIEFYIGQSLNGL